MRMCQSRTVLLALVLVALSATLGCAQRMTAVKSDSAVESVKTAELLAVKVADESGRLDIIANKPLTYTFYKMSGPPKLVIDLAQTLPGAVAQSVDVNQGLVKRVEVSQHTFGAGVMSRVEVFLTEDNDVSVLTDSTDKKVLHVTFAKAPLPIISQEKIAVVPSPTTPAPELTTGQPAKADQPLAEQDKTKDVPAVPVEVKAVVVSTPEQPAPDVTPAPKDAAPPAATPVQKVEETQPAKNDVPVNAGKSVAAVVVPLKADTPPSAVAEAGTRTITGVNKVDDSITIEVKGGVDSYNSFKLTQPERLVIDIPATKNGLTAKTIDIKAFGLDKARIGWAADKVRIVFDSQNGSISPYQISKNENGLKINFTENAKPSDQSATPVVAEKIAVPEQVIADKKVMEPVQPTTMKTDPVKTAKKSSTKVKGKAKAASLESIEFRQLDGIAQIAIKVDEDCEASQPVKSTKGVSLTIKNCLIPKNLQRQINTSGFVSVVQGITPYPVKVKSATDTHILVKLRQDAPFTLKKEGSTYYLEFKDFDRASAPIPAPVLGAEAGEPKLPVATPKENRFAEESISMERVAPTSSKPAKKYTGRKVSLEFADADIRKIFQLIAEVSNLNFLISDDVSGTISLKLVNVPWDQALDVILENKSLGMQRDGNIVQIRPKSKIKTLDEEEVERKVTEEKKMDLKTVIFDVNFANIGDVEKQFKAVMSKRTDVSISTDARTNKVIVVDIEPSIRKMKGLLESLDIPEKQVMIEARIVEASSNFTRDLGVQWNFQYKDGAASFANINSATSSFGGIVSTVLPTTTTGGLAQSMSFGKLINNIQLDLRLSAAATIGQVKIISTPKVLTVNNKSAKISQGQSIPYQTTSAEGTKTEFIEAALTLEVTPHITADGSVNMKIKASNNSPGSGTPPPINKKEATTELVVKNGETTVIGGIFVDTDTETDTGVPFLSDIPLLGWLFKSNSKSKTKTELLIFITPKIVG